MDHQVTSERINSQLHIDFLTKLLEERTRPLILLADRVPFHHSKPFVRRNRHRIRVFFLPRYAPESNPAEELREEVMDNQLGRQAARNVPDLKRRLL
jgi:transposase